MTERPYVQNIRGKWRIVWAEVHDGEYTPDKQIGQHKTYNNAEAACVAVYGITPEAYGIGF